MFLMIPRGLRRRNCNFAPEPEIRFQPARKALWNFSATDDVVLKLYDPTRLRVWVRAVDSTGQTIEFLLTAKRDTAAAKRFFRKALSSPGNPVPRVINVDKNPAYPAVVESRLCAAGAVLLGKLNGSGA